MPPITERAHPAMHFMPQAFNPIVWRGVKFLLPLWLRFKLAIASVQAENLDLFVQQYQEFQQGKSRLLIAFRHPSTADPFSMAYLVWYLVPQAARESGVRLKPPIHSHFLYDRGIALWAGNIVNWLFPKIGGSSIFRGKADREGLKAARELLCEGRFPLSIAPEGSTNDHSELVSPLEPGVAQLGFWCKEDLMKANRPESVHILPISLRYEYIRPPWDQLDHLLDQLETDLGLPPDSVAPTGQIANLELDRRYARLLRIGSGFLDRLEIFYAQNYGRTALTHDLEGNDSLAPNAKIVARLHRGLDEVLQVAEEFFGLSARGSFSDRCRRLEQAAWDRMFLDHLDQLSPLDRGLADWNAAEASLRLGHMRLAERLVCMTSDYILARPSADRFAEVVLILWRISVWIKGESPHAPPNLGQQRVKAVVCPPIIIDDYWDQYQTNRRSARQSVQEVTHALQGAFEGIIQANLRSQEISPNAPTHG
ncbi:1-acyl-sn-glycerol-3-phosphate acyltransferase [Lyngbya confervoides]|uniref:1-acyl-sn-glycerol-3-phosphate acyltransferase n=1 Tax=Lyngbya confervoides BDU141951 TaxID=1574623 RepID=A0ABD4SXD1_9CYAN|nr:1-acyl-sn-glycerol-3-phosphate acyltransferase [Lyngbya confervoides]MCM1981302.1 1-acyl-sn-glycerol-3-phosphate acyltransferase [Lyngbya confervoides BDU141951]